MTRLYDGQRAALDALCRAIVPAAFENPRTADLAAHVEARIAELGSYHRARALLALRLFAGRMLPLMLLGRPVRFARLSPELRERLLKRCATHGQPHVRLLFNSVRRLVLHTHYGRPEARREIGHAGPLHEREKLYSWEGAVLKAEPVVSAVTRDVIRERHVPEGVHEARTLTHDLALNTRVCIIGSGVGGATAAAQLARAGHEVIMLEAGGYHTAADFGDDETHALRTLYADSGLRSTDELNVSILQGSCAGGGSTVNWMVMLRTPDNVIDEWFDGHGMENHDTRSMHAAFARFEQENNVGLVAEHAHSPINRLILDGARRLGWRAHSAAVNARDCMRVGSCGLGCRYDAKQSALLTELPRALQHGAQLYCDVAAQHIERRGRGFRVHGAVTNGRNVVVHCDVVILAAGAVATPTLMQRSALAPAGTGRNLRLHPTTAVVGLYEEPFYAATGIPLTAYCDEFMGLNDGYGYWIEAPPLTAGLAAVALPGFGRQHRDFMRQFPYLAPLIVLVRDGAPRGGSVGTVRRGAQSRIRYRLGDADREMLQHGIESAARIHFSAGARCVLTLHGRQTLLRDDADLPLIREATARYGDPALFSAHVNGTARIGRDGNTSTCRADGQVHGQPGLYVMDGSLLPTAPGVNPHETIAGVVRILAQELAGVLG